MSWLLVYNVFGTTHFLPKIAPNSFIIDYRVVHDYVMTPFDCFKALFEPLLFAHLWAKVHYYPQCVTVFHLSVISHTNPNRSTTLPRQLILRAKLTLIICASIFSNAPYSTLSAPGPRKTMQSLYLLVACVYDASCVPQRQIWVFCMNFLRQRHSKFKWM